MKEELRGAKSNDQADAIKEVMELIMAGQVSGLAVAVLTKDKKVRLALTCKDDCQIEMIGVLEMLKHKATTAAFLPAPAKEEKHEKS